jgi:hypothetical protein
MASPYLTQRESLPVLPILTQAILHIPQGILHVAAKQYFICEAYFIRVTVSRLLQKIENFH